MRPLLFLLLCCALVAKADGPLARDYLPDQISSPTLWWALDLGSDQPDAPDPTALIAALASWLAQPPPALRPLPVDGLNLGLLANMPDAQGRVAARILHPPLALAAVRDWPAQTRHRQVALAAGARLDGSGDWQRPWALAGMADALILSLPLPALADPSLLRAELSLPLQQLPADMPAMLLRLHDPAAGLADWQGLLPGHPADGLLLDLLPALQAWQRAGKALPAQVQVDIRPQPSRDSERGVWRPWQPGAPAGWRLSWQEPAHAASAREQLQRTLSGLLAMPGQLPSGTAPDLWQAMQTLLADNLPASESVVPTAPSAACLPAAGLLIGTRSQLASLPLPVADGLHRSPPAQVWHLTAADESRPQDDGLRQLSPPQLPAALARWQDHQLAPPVLADGWWPRLRGSQLLGWDMTVLQPVPGRRLWPGNLLPHPCRADETCADVPPPPPRLDTGLRTFDRAASALLLSDLGVSDGQPLVQLPLAEADPPPPHAGAMRWLDTGVANGFLLWLSTDGQLQLLDGGDAHPLWRWQPARLSAARALLRQEPPAAEPERLSPSRLLLWPTDAATPPRSLHVAVLGELLALDISDPLRPRRLFQTDLPQGWLGSLSLFTISHGDGRRQPLLLAASRPGLDPAQAGLRLLDGNTGQLLWQASATASGDSSNAALAAGWRAPWAMRPDPGGSLRLHGMDAGGQVWRLLVSLDGSDSLRVSAPQLIARLPAGVFTASHDEALSLSWLRYQGLLVPALAAPASSGAEATAIYAWLDLPRDSPLSGDALTLWPADTLRPPEHSIGWRRPLAADERIAAPPRWLRRQLVLTTQIRQTSAGCQPPSWRQRLLMLPWQREQAGASEITGRQIERDASAPGPPLLQANGSLQLPGGGDGVLVPAAAGLRERLGKQLLPRP